MVTMGRLSFFQVLHFENNFTSFVCGYTKRERERERGERREERGRVHMDMEEREINVVVGSNDINNSKKRPQKCLLYDRRYGLVYDVWTDPSEEALSGGRGMFCIVPLAKALINSASYTINHVAHSTLKVLENPDLFKPQVLQANINSQLQRVKSSVKKPEFDLAMLMKTQPLSCYPHGERSEIS